MTITLTNAAANRIKMFLRKQKDAIGIKFGVKTTGCSGLAYTTDLTDKISDDYVEFESLGIKIFTHKENLSYLDGTEIDFIKDGFQESFKFNNPNAKAECGCGESFTT
jgi:iron-sulfur cluster assembly protein